jgi:hypothetical protein
MKIAPGDHGMKVAPLPGRVGGLAPVRVVRDVEPFHPPVGFPSGVLDAVRAELSTLGHESRYSAPDAVAFDGSGIHAPLYLTGLVSSGTVTFHTAASGPVARLELRLNPWLTYGWALIAAFGIAAMPSRGARVLGLILLAMFTVFNFLASVGRYTACVHEGVRRGTVEAGLAALTSAGAGRSPEAPRAI